MAAKDVIAAAARVPEPQREGGAARPVRDGSDRARPANPGVREPPPVDCGVGATSGPGSVMRIVKASPVPSGIERHSPAKQNQSSPALVNFHFDFGGLVPVNSKKCEAGIRERPFGNRRPSERKLITGAPLGRAGGNPQHSCTSSTPSSRRRKTGAGSVGQMSSRGSRFGGAVGKTISARI